MGGHVQRCTAAGKHEALVEALSVMPRKVALVVCEHKLDVARDGGRVKRFGLYEEEQAEKMI